MMSSKSEISDEEMDSCWLNEDKMPEIIILF